MGLNMMNASKIQQASSRSFAGQQSMFGAKIAQAPSAANMRMAMSMKQGFNRAPQMAAVRPGMSGSATSLLGAQHRITEQLR